MEVSEAAWLKQLAQYDDVGIKLLFEQYYTPLVLFAKSYVRDFDVAKDIVQDVFLIMIQGKEKFFTIDNLKTYLYSAVKNRSLKYIRHEDVKMRYNHYVLEHNDDGGYAEEMLEEEVFVLLKKSIGELPDQCRKVFELALLGKGNAEIASALGIGIETVKSHKKAGKQILFGKLRNFMPVLFFSYYCSKYID